jgi:hypothetical protein
MIDLASQVQQANQNSQAFANVATDAATQSTQLAGQKADLETGLGRAQAAVATTEETAKLALQKRNYQAADLFGTNPDTTSYIIGQLKDKSDAAFAERESALADIKQKQSINLLDNPLGFIVAQATINSDIERHNTADAEVTMYDDRIKELNSLTQTQAITNNATAISTSTANIADKAVVASAAANIAALDAKAQGLHWNVQFLQAANSASREQLTSAFQLHAARQSEAQLAIAQQHLAMTREEFEWKKDQKTKNEQEDGFLITNIQRGYQIATGKQFTGSPSEALMLYKAKDPAVTAWYANGRMSESTGMSILATNPMDALLLAGKKVIVPNAGTRPVIEKFADYASTFKATPEAQQALANASKDKGASYEQAFTSYVNKQLQVEATNADRSSILRIPSLDTYIPSNPTLANSPLWVKVLKDAAIDKSDANALFATTTAAMREGKISYVDALDLQRYIAAGVLANGATKNFAGLGVVQPKSYTVRLNTGSGGSSSVNMADPNALATAFNQVEARRVAAKFSGRGDTGPGFANGDVFNLAGQPALIDQK